jgi:hypothetical protein
MRAWVSVFLMTVYFGYAEPCMANEAVPLTRTWFEDVYQTAQYSGTISAGADQIGYVMGWENETGRKYKIVFLTEDDYCFSYGESFGGNTPIKGEMQCASGARASWRMLLHNIITMKLRFSDNPRVTVTWKLGVREIVPSQIVLDRFLELYERG